MAAEGGQMLKHRKRVPLDYSLCRMTVTVYTRQDGKRHILKNVHYEMSDQRVTEQGRVRIKRGFLLVIPGSWNIHPGDKILAGEGPQGLSWDQLGGETPGLGVVTSVKPRYFEGRLCHLEVRG